MSETPARIVLDTNVLISWLLLENSVPGRVAAQVVRARKHLVSMETLSELADVLARPKFDRYVTIEQRNQFIRLIGRTAQMIPIAQQVRACRDPKDDKFLELAINGRADLILTGNADLLALHPFLGIIIQRPGEHLSGS